MRKADVSARSSEKVRKLTAIAAYGGNMTIGQRIRMYREKKGKSRAAMERETGKTVFLTREEAEKALEARKDG